MLFHFRLDGADKVQNDLIILNEHGEPFLRCQGEAFSVGAPKGRPSVQPEMKTS